MSPSGVVFDGVNIWTSNFGSNNVTKLRASDGTVLGTFPAGLGPNGICFDGANIWVTDFNSTTVTELLATSGVTLNASGFLMHSSSSSGFAVGICRPWTISKMRDVLQLSRWLSGDVKESRNGNPTRDLQVAADRTWHHPLFRPVVSSLFSLAARC